MKLRRYKNKRTDILKKTKQSDKDNLILNVSLKESPYLTNQQLIKVLELENIGFWIKSPENDELWFSEIAAEIIGIESAESTLPVDFFLSNVYQEDRIPLEQYIKEIFNNRKVVEHNYRMTKFNSDVKEVIHISTRITNIIDPVSNQNIKIGTLSDITKLEKFKRELTKFKEKAEEANMQKNIFLANISHEIRTPMNSILGFSELLNIGNLDAKTRKEYFNIIINQSQQLQKLVDDISELAKYETGDLSINKSPCNFNLLLNELLISFNQQKLKLNKENVEIKINLPANEEIIAYTDSGRVTQILSNLINTSMYYTDKGYIEIGYYKTNDLKLEFYVKDTGIGFTKDEQKYIFDRLLQVQDTAIKKFEGIGLNLTISKGLVKLMGGRIWLESEPGSGSTFYFQIPFEEIPRLDIVEEHEEEFRFPQYNWKDKLILIVEDDEVNYKFLEAALHKTEAQIIQANNGFQAIDLCKSISKIDLILMDLKLPDMNGFEATRQIRKFNKTIPIIAQTALVFEKEREGCFKAGCNDQITKPIEIEKLLKMINKYFNE